MYKKMATLVVTIVPSTMAYEQQCMTYTDSGRHKGFLRL